VAVLDAEVGGEDTSAEELLASDDAWEAGLGVTASDEVTSELDEATASEVDEEATSGEEEGLSEVAADVTTCDEVATSDDGVSERAVSDEVSVELVTASEVGAVDVLLKVEIS